MKPTDETYGQEFYKALEKYLSIGWEKQSVEFFMDDFKSFISQWEKEHPEGERDNDTYWVAETNIDGVIKYWTGTDPLSCVMNPDCEIWTNDIHKALKSKSEADCVKELSGTVLSFYSIKEHMDSPSSSEISREEMIERATEYFEQQNKGRSVEYYLDRGEEISPLTSVIFAVNFAIQEVKNVIEQFKNRLYVEIK